MQHAHKRTRQHGNLATAHNSYGVMAPLKPGAKPDTPLHHTPDSALASASCIHAAHTSNPKPQPPSKAAVSFCTTQAAAPQNFPCSYSPRELCRTLLRHVSACHRIHPCPALHARLALIPTTSGQPGITFTSSAVAIHSRHTICCGHPQQAGRKAAANLSHTPRSKLDGKKVASWPAMRNAPPTQSSWRIPSS